MKIVSDDGPHITLHIPQNNWRVQLAPYFYVYFEKAPNAFWRLMQRLILGFKWEKLPPSA